MRSYKYIAIFLSFFFLFNANAQKRNRHVLLRIDHEKIRAYEFIRAYRKSNAAIHNKDTANIDEYLDLYINFRLKIKQAKDLKLDTIKRLKTELDGYRKLLAETYFFDQETDEQLLKEAYDRLFTDIRASHILIRCPENASPEDTLEAYDKIQDIRKKALKGESFSDLALQFSEDLSARDQTDAQGNIIKGNAGDLGYFSVFDMAYPFENMAYKTPLDSISQPLKTELGYHLLKITDRHQAIGEVTVSQIFLAHDNLNPATENSRKRIFEIYKMLEAGANFEELVKLYSEDQSSKANQGVMEPFVANDLVPEFYLAIFGIDKTGGFSEPVRTPFGWHIIKLINRRIPGNYKDETDFLNKKIKNDARSEISKKVKIDKIKKQFVFKSYPIAKERLFEAIDINLLTAHWDLENAAAYEADLFKIGKQRFTQKDFADFIAKRQSKNNFFTLKAYYDYLYEAFVNETCSAFYLDKLVDLDPEFKEITKEYEDGILLFELSEQKVWKKSMEDKLGLANFYQINQSKYSSKDFNAIKGLVISDYQNFLENEWLKELRSIYKVKINKKTLNKLQ